MLSKLYFVLLAFLLIPIASAIDVFDCGVLNQTGQTYVLQNDVSNAHSCFLIHADDITFDLNGHTITYATNPTRFWGPDNETQCMTYNSIMDGIICQFGIISDGDPRGARDFPEANWEHRDGITIKNGRIVQHQNAGRFSDAIRGWGAGWTVANLTILLNRTDATAVHGEGDPRWNVYGLKIDADIEEDITNRHQWVPGISVGSYSLVHDNSISGVPHMGIAAGSNSIIERNNISNEEWGDNAFGIGLYGADDVIIRNNIINTVRGRGILLDAGADRTLVENNTIDVHHVCRPTTEACTGTYGIRIRYASKDNVIRGNTVIARAYDGERATAMILTPKQNESSPDYVAPLNNIIEGNTFIALTDGTAEANGIVFEANPITQVPGNIVRNNIILTQDIGVNFYGSNCESNNILVENTTIIDYGSPAFAPVAMGSCGGPSQGHVLFDTQIVGGMWDDARFGGLCASPNLCEFAVENTVIVRVIDASGNAVSGASVEVRNSVGALLASGMTATAGSYSGRVRERTVLNGVASVYGPFSVRVVSGSYDMVRLASLDMRTTLVFMLSPACSVPDSDGDGFASIACGEMDCDDSVASTHPGALEVCQDGVDNDCSSGDAVCGVCSAGPVPRMGCLCNGVPRSSGVCWVVGSPISLQQGKDGYFGAVDAEIWGQEPDTTREWTAIRNMNGDWTWKELIKFDISGIPPGATVQSAVLKLSHSAGWYPPSRVSVSRVLKSWTKPGVTWRCTNDVGQNGCAGEIPWLTAGIGVNDKANSVVITVTPGAWNAWDVTPAVRSWVEGGSVNGGFVIEELDGQWQTFRSSQSFPVETRPMLVVTLASVPSTACGAYDSDSNGLINMSEAAPAIQDWYQGNIGMSYLVNVLKSWIDGVCYT
ncbi:MAG: DNRLRE domain-containing protein [Candidatus Woesearchaeota archaeon]